MTQHSLLPLDGPSCIKVLRRRYHSTVSPSLASYSSTSSASNLSSMHPEPRHIFRMWQIFTERTNPMVKVIHAPTVHQRIMDTCWNLEHCSYSFHALLFAIYLLAVVSLSSEECVSIFGSDRSTLMARYGNAAWLSMLASNVLETRDLEVLQALVLFIVRQLARHGCAVHD